MLSEGEKQARMSEDVLKLRRMIESPSFSRWAFVRGAYSVEQRWFRVKRPLARDNKDLCALVRLKADVLEGSEQPRYVRIMSSIISNKRKFMFCRS